MEGIGAICLSEFYEFGMHETIPLIYSLTRRCSIVLEIKVWVSKKNG